MWIRSQNGRLINCNNMLPYQDTQKKWCVAEEVHISSYREKHGGRDVGRFYMLGKYKSKKRCIEVLDEIEEAIQNGEEIGMTGIYKCVYQMPSK